MNKITNPDDLVRELVGGGWRPKSANPIASSDYVGLNYKCGCGDHHALRDTSFILIGTPVKFVFNCHNDYLTGVQVKGFFSQKSIELWTCKNQVYLEAAKIAEES
jgi:hypothetical protein